MAKDFLSALCHPGHLSGPLARGSAPAVLGAGRKCEVDWRTCRREVGTEAFLLEEDRRGQAVGFGDEDRLASVVLG